MSVSLHSLCSMLSWGSSSGVSTVLASMDGNSGSHAQNNLSSQEVSLSVGSVRGVTAEEIRLPIRIDLNGSEEVNSLNFSLEYDRDGLKSEAKNSKK